LRMGPSGRVRAARAPRRQRGRLARGAASITKEYGGAKSKARISPLVVTAGRGAARLSGRATAPRHPPPWPNRASRRIFRRGRVCLDRAQQEEAMANQAEQSPPSQLALPAFEAAYAPPDELIAERLLAGAPRPPHAERRIDTRATRL